MPAKSRENPLTKTGNFDAFFREKYLTKNRSGGGRQIVTDGGFKGRDINGDGEKEPALRYTDNSTDKKEE